MKRTYFHAHVPSDDLLQKIPILIINTVQSGLLTQLLHIKVWLHERLTKDVNEAASILPLVKSSAAARTVHPLCAEAGNEVYIELYGPLKIILHMCLKHLITCKEPHFNSTQPDDDGLFKASPRPRNNGRMSMPVPFLQTSLLYIFLLHSRTSDQALSVIED